jgi:hypothetical protein
MTMHKTMPRTVKMYEVKEWKPEITFGVRIAR